MKYLIFSILLITSYVGNCQLSTYLDSRDNTTYNTVSIDSRIWMTDNLNYITLQSQESTSVQQSKHTLSGRYYHMDELDSICPSEWRIPDVDDWMSYFKYIATLVKRVELRITNIDDPVHYTIANYSDKIDLFAKGNLLNIAPTGRIESGNQNIPDNYSDY